MTNFTEEDKKWWKEYNDWYFKCPCGHNAIPFVNDVMDASMQVVKHPHNYTKEEFEEYIDSRLKEHDKKKPMYVSSRDVVLISLTQMKWSRSPKMCVWTNWVFTRKSWGHTPRWYDEKSYKIAEAVCILGMDDIKEIFKYAGINI